MIRENTRSIMVGNIQIGHQNKCILQSMCNTPTKDVEKTVDQINRLVKNDIVTVTDLSGRKVNYYVYEYGITSKDDSSYLAQPDDKNTKMITLVTCTKGGKERYYVKAKAK